MLKSTPINVNTPPDTGEPLKFGASRIRELKQGIIELWGIDHYTGSASSGSYNDPDAGKHKQVSLVDASGDALGTISVIEDPDGNPELFFTDQADNQVQLTAGGEFGTVADGVSAYPKLRLLNTQATNADGDFKGEVVFEGRNGVISKIVGSHYGTEDDEKGRLKLEVSDGSAFKTVEINEEEIDCGGLPVKNIGEPVDDTDAVTKEYVDSKITSASESIAVSGLSFGDCTQDEKSGPTFSMEPGETIHVIVTGSISGYKTDTRIALFFNEVAGGSSSEANSDIVWIGAHDGKGQKGKNLTLAGVYTNENEITANVTPKIRKNNTSSYHSIKFTCLKF